MKFYSFNEFKKDVKTLAKDIKKFNPQALVAVARGGMSLAHSLAVILNNRSLFCINSIHYDDTNKLDNIKIFNIPDLSGFERVLVIDDIVDSGESLVAINNILKEKYPLIEFKIATIFYKKAAIIKPDFKVKKTKEWIDFFWDIRA
ncbi:MULTISPECIES: phosphoribosyltransferase [unclassified Campylobacter]|uniref:phosphoribosyltransferase n=1 Tax=unclassified Campylobacter TaxID=2593542 RepID=UPI0012380527|nr:MULTISPECIES: phosphoribosyltransferase family protein [unclassified Campylobacter]KAA6224940.1 phosphoribosyltransferase [Campylobacter sp. LR286c]KAA6228395.1 phosphoribosyltransferase [Campylobacter sp. LR185c]KAA6228881.1 phosphoribosyltransferase [Campylobacter sp. LR196d]KAA6229835.1 phosphoribosyltransferase [Campylobacter sp. LR264d]KAA6234046.1 phosphoribosyltransferase [Campylobacter sp. LR291e]